MSRGLKSMESIFQAFRDPVPSSSEGSLTLPDLVRFLERQAPGYSVSCYITKGKFITVSLTISGNGDADDEVGNITREAVATIEDNDVWDAYELAFLRVCAMWGLVAGSADPTGVDRLLADLDLGGR